MSLILNIEKRDLKNKFPAANKVESLTESIKGVFYNKKEESTPITIPYADFKKVRKEAGGSSLITLKGIGEDKEVIIQDIDFDPITDNPRHVDFYVIERGKAMEAEIPLEFIGVSPAIKELGGMLVKASYELKIEVLPKDLPKMIEVDISLLLDFDSQILAKDLKLPESAKIIGDENEVIAIITEPKEMEEEVIPEAGDIAEVEIEKKGKPEEEAPVEDKPSEK
ncbi:MAG: 50S ribosomal protein L25 [Candidatus Pacebacteria bacterium]|nr:50S ribosomal protein L25 [Candidatus Paceibacterota bacterium]